MSLYRAFTPLSWRTFFLLLILALCSASLLFAVHRAAASSDSPSITLPNWTYWAGTQPPTYAQCKAALGVPCFSPQELRQAYDLTSLVNGGDTGKGQTIVIIDSYGSPTAWSDLQQFDKNYGLPNPPSFKELAPFGSVPFDPTNQDQLGWAGETSLDIQWSHAMAPDASIVVLTSPVSETAGVQGMPQFLQLEQYALDHHLGQIISQSWGTPENTLFTPAGQQVFHAFEQFYQQAALHDITVLSSAGDSGSANRDVNGNPYPFPTVVYPAASPWVTAVGGTSLNADVNGTYLAEIVWNALGRATGGGKSQEFSEPFYQQLLPKSDQQLLNGHRGLPDVALNAGTPVPVYMSFFPSSSNANGYHLGGGTSASAPEWAGITADANQYVGHPLGFLNPLLYRLGMNKDVYAQDFHDITTGNNSEDGIPGYQATPGWDATTGWGTPIVQQLFQTLKDHRL